MIAIIETLLSFTSAAIMFDIEREALNSLKHMAFKGTLLHSPS